MQQSEFKIGDVVVLKSGGRPMTVIKILDSENTQCLRDDWDFPREFPSAILELYEPPTYGTVSYVW